MSRWWRWRPASSPQQPPVLLRRDLRFPQNLAYERAGKIAARVVGRGGRTTIRVPKEDVATVLSNYAKAQAHEQSFHRLVIDDGKLTQTATSTCSSPTRRGTSSSEPSNSSKQSSRTSFKLARSSFRSAAWVCAPGIPGTVPV